MIRAGVEPRTIWRTVHACHLADANHPLKRLSHWRIRAKYAQRHPGEISGLFLARDDRLESQSKYSIVLFDALDRSADDWSTALRLIRGLLRHALGMRSYRRLRAKVFLGPDHADEPSVVDFPDASKIL